MNAKTTKERKKESESNVTPLHFHNLFLRLTRAIIVTLSIIATLFQ